MNGDRWTPKNLTLFLLSLSWAVLAAFAIFRDKPVPPIPILPFYASSNDYAFSYRYRPDGTLQLAPPSTERARGVVDGAPRGDGARHPAPDYQHDPYFADSIGGLAVDSNGDRCYGKACKVTSLQVTPAVLFANLPTCTAALAGQLRYTSDQGFVQCTGAEPWTALGGTAGSEPLTVSAPLAIFDDGGTVNISISGVANEQLWNGECAACTTDLNFMAPMRAASAYSVGRIDCVWETAGTVGSTNASIQIYDVTAAASVCTCAIGACNTSGRAPLGCTCSGTLVAGNTNAIRFSSKGDCTLAPQNTGCTVHLGPP